MKDNNFNSLKPNLNNLQKEREDMKTQLSNIRTSDGMSGNKMPQTPAITNEINKRSNPNKKTNNPYGYNRISGRGGIK